MNPSSFVKRSLWCLLAFLCCGVEGWGQCSNTSMGGSYTCIQAVHCGTPATTCAFPSNVGAHHLLIYTVGANNTGVTGWAPTGTNNTYTSAILSAGGSTPRELQIFYACDSTAGAETVTANPNNASTYQDSYVYEISGTATSNCLDTTKSGTFSNDGATKCSGNFTVISGDLVIGQGLAANGSIAAGTGYALRVAGDSFFGEEDKTESTTTANACFSVTTGGNDDFAHAAAFKASGGGSTPKSVIVGGGIQ